MGVRKIVVPALVIVGACTALAGCSRQNDFPDRVASARAAETKAPGDASALPASFQRTYVGTIGGKYPITMDLSLRDGRLYGSYRYDGKTASLKLDGTLSRDGKVDLNESDGERGTGFFTGTMAGDAMSGVWGVQRSKPKWRFDVHKSADVTDPPKSEALRAAVGSYELVAIDGNFGANGMTEYEKSQGVWSLRTSSISNAQREFFDESLSGRELGVLNSARVEVDERLTTRLLVGSRLLLELPFTANGMRFERITYPEKDLPVEWKSMSPSTTYIDHLLYLAAMGATDFSKELAVKRLVNRGALVVEFDPGRKVFRLSLNNADSGDGNVLTFQRK